MDDSMILHRVKMNMKKQGYSLMLAALSAATMSAAMMRGLLLGRGGFSSADVEHLLKKKKQIMIYPIMKCSGFDNCL